MKKILLVGSFTDDNEFAFMEGLSKEYQVQMCPFELKSVEGMTKIAKPDLVLLYASGQTDGQVFEFFNTKKADLPLLLLISKEDFLAVRQYCSGDAYHILYIPCQDMEILEVCRNIFSARSSSEKVSAHGAGSRKNILVVDDDPLMLRNIKELLKSEFNISLAKSGKDALASIGDHRPDLVLLDYEMPKWLLNGSDTFKKIREMEGDPLPVIFLTGVTDKNKVMEILKHKPDGYILKPPDRDMLLERIHEVLKEYE